MSSQTEDTDTVNKIIKGDCLDELKKLPDQYVQTCVTSPPYFGLRDYGVDGQIGLEETLEAYCSGVIRHERVMLTHSTPQTSTHIQSAT